LALNEQTLSSTYKHIISQYLFCIKMVQTIRKSNQIYQNNKN
jgi:hypothetical protein